MKDKNGIEVKSGDLVRTFENCNGTIKTWDAVVKTDDGKMVLYDPTCCYSCRHGFGYICEVGEVGSFEVVDKSKISARDISRESRELYGKLERNNEPNAINEVKIAMNLKYGKLWREERELNKP